MKSSENPIIVLTGPTGSGKTAISMEIAKRYGNIEIICADSTTVYRGMDIGTDKPTLHRHSEQSEESRPRSFVPTQDDEGVVIRGVKHHMLDIIDPDKEFNVSIFLDKVTTLVDQIHGRGNIPMLVGGAVMYIDAFVFNYELPPVAPNEGLRQELEKLETPELFAKLCKLDPDAEWTIDGKNRRRIIRAIEVWMGTERPFSEQKSKTPLPANILYLAVNRDRDELYKSIDMRVDQMFRDGLIEEVKALLPKYRGTIAMNSTGYKQITEFLDGNSPLEEAVVAIKQAHRNYAKRQLTWLRKNPDVKWISCQTEAIHLISQFLKE